MIGRKAAMVLAVIAAMMAAPCGMAVGTGGTGLKAYSRGAIASVSGRVAVNGVQWQAGDATIIVNGRPGRAQDDLRDGMVADVDGDLAVSAQQGRASNIAVTRVALGIVARVGTGGTGLKAAGLVVAPAANVVVAGAGSLSDLADGDWVDVYGYTDGESGQVHATRIERVSAAGATELHGTIVALNAGAMVVNGVHVDASSALLDGFGSGPQVGDRVAVFGVASGDGLVATEVRFDASAGPAEAPSAEVEDAVEAVLDVGRFVLSDIEVDARSATLTGGVLTDIVAGRVMHVRGALVGGVLVATQVGFDDDADGEVEGVIESVAANGTFVVHGVTIDPAGATITGGTIADLAAGRRVQVEGARHGGLLRAARIGIEDARNAGAGAADAPDDADKPPSVASPTAGDRRTEVSGTVSSIDASGRFSVGTVMVDASQARVGGGSLGQVRVGMRVEAAGAMKSGVLVATRLEIDD